MKNLHKAEKKTPLPLAVAVGIFISLIVTLGGAMLTTAMIHGQSWNENSYSVASFVIWLLASFAGATIAGIMAKDRPWLGVLFNAVIYMLILLSVSILFFDGKLGAIGQGIIAVLLGAAPAMLLLTRKTNGINRKIRYPKW